MPSPRCVVEEVDDFQQDGNRCKGQGRVEALVGSHMLDNVFRTLQHVGGRGGLGFSSGVGCLVHGGDQGKGRICRLYRR